MERRIHKKIYFILIVAIVFSNIKTIRASVIDDIASLFGFGNSEKVVAEVEETSKGNGTEKAFDESQKEVVTTIDEILKKIKNVNIDHLEEDLDYDIGKNNVDDVKSFFDDNKDAKNNMQYVLKNFSYDIEDIKVLNDTAKAKVRYSLPSIKELFVKIMPKIVIKNAASLFNDGITSDTASLIIEYIKNELQRGAIKNESFVYDFSLKKVENKWVLTDIDTIISDVIKYIRDIVV